MPDDMWAVRGVPKYIRRKVKEYAAAHDMTVAEALTDLVEDGLLFEEREPDTEKQDISIESSEAFLKLLRMLTPESRKTIAELMGLFADDDLYKREKREEKRQQHARRKQQLEETQRQSLDHPDE